MVIADRIEINPAVMLGKPVIRGTRIPVELITRKLSTAMRKFVPNWSAQKSVNTLVLPYELASMRAKPEKQLGSNLRIPVLSEGATEADLLDAYPRLTQADIRAALAYAAQSV
jgi:uncharacterized protein (DUF433 family)